MKWSASVIAGSLVMLVAACGSNAPASTTSTTTTTPSAAHASTSTPALAPVPDLTAELLSVSSGSARVGVWSPAARPRASGRCTGPERSRCCTSVRYRSYSEQAWKPALASASIIAGPMADERGRPRYQTTRKEGPHQLRHYYASVLLHGGVSIKELAEYLGHHDPAFKLRVYSHLVSGSHERARQVFDSRLFRPRAVADGT